MLEDILNTHIDRTEYTLVYVGLFTCLALMGSVPTAEIISPTAELHVEWLRYKLQSNYRVVRNFEKA